MNREVESVYPDLLKAGLDRLRHVEAQREVLGLFSALEHFRRDLHVQDSTAGILNIAHTYIGKLGLFGVAGFWLVNPSDFSFEPAFVLPEEERVSLWRLVDREIKAGRFARALRQSGSTFTHSDAHGTPEHALFHPLALSNQVLGMFCGLLRAETSHEVVFSVLSLLLGETTDAMATLRRTKQLTGQIDVLDGLLPLCAWCKKVRNDSGYWEQIERYIAQNSRTSVTHGICPDCRKKFLESIPQ